MIKRKSIAALLIVFSSITFNAHANEINNKSNVVSVVTYGNIKESILNKNIVVKINENTVKSLEINYDSLIEAEEDLKDGITKMQDLIIMYRKQLQLFYVEPSSSDEAINTTLSNINMMVRGIFTGNMATIQGNITSMETQLKNLKDQKDDMSTTISKITLNGELVNNQMVWTGENLIFAYDAIDVQMRNIDKNITMLQDQLRILNIQEDLGHISKIDTESIKLKIEELNSTKETLDNQKLNIKRQLNLLLGQSYNTTLEVSFTPELSAYKISSMNSKNDLITAIEKSYELKLKKYEVEAKESALLRVEKADDLNLNKQKLAKIDLENVNLQLEDAKRNYELKFQQLYETVKDKQKVMSLEEKKLAQEKTKLEAATKKYDLGMISKVEYDNVKLSYDLQGIKVETAKSELFTSYRKYEWMLKGLSV